MESKSSIVYSSILICHGFMNSGTTNDFFLRDNLEWLSKATNWSKFTATASLGVVQKVLQNHWWMNDKLTVFTRDTSKRACLFWPLTCLNKANSQALIPKEVHCMLSVSFMPIMEMRLLTT